MISHTINVSPIVSQQLQQVFDYNYEINYNILSKTYNITVKTFKPEFIKLENCQLNCKNKFTSKTLNEIKENFNNKNDEEKKMFLKKCIIIKTNQRMKKKKKYKRNRSYICYYYLSYNAQQIRVCQRCFRSILGLKQYNLTNIIKESLCNLNHV